MTTRDFSDLQETLMSAEDDLVLYCEMVNVPQAMRASTWGSANAESFAYDGPRGERTILFSLESAGLCLCAQV